MNKKNTRVPLISKKGLEKLIWSMIKTYVLCLCFGLSSIYAKNAYGQKKIDIDVNEVSIERFFEEIQKKSNFIFFYNDDVVDELKKISLKTNKESITSILKRVLSNNNLAFKIIDRQIIITKEEKPKITQQIVSGKITDNKGTPLLGVTILIEGENKGVTSDFDGNYEIPANKGQVLVFSYIGMKEKKVPVGDSTVIDVTLEDDVEGLEEVVITGYQNIKKVFFTGASQSLKAADIKLEGVPDVSRSLEGRAAGVSIQNVTGTFGATPKITIRGSSSILGDTKPIWIIDGAIQEEIINLSLNDLVSGDTNTLLSSAVAGLNAADIENIEILKDASATALYGARALNGVVVITTKSGKRNEKTTVNYSSEYAVRAIPRYNQFNLLNSQETVSIYRELESKGFLSLPNSLQGRFGGIYNLMYNRINTFNPETNSFLLANTPEAKARFLQQYELANTDWFKTLFRPTPTQTHSLSFSGGGENSAQYASIGYFTDPGWTIADRVRRLTGNLRNTYFLGKKHKVTVLIQGSYRDQNAPGSFDRQTDVVNGSFNRDFDINPFSYALNTSRAIRPRDNQGNLEYTRYNWAPFNILNELKTNTTELKVLDLKFQGEFETKLTENLKYNFLGTARYANSTNEHKVREDSNVAGAYRSNETTIVEDANIFLFSDPDDPNSRPQVVLPSGGIYTRRENRIVTYNFRNTLDFTKELGDKSDLRVYLGQEFRFVDREQSFNRGFGYQFSRGGVPFTDPDIINKLILDGGNYFGLTQSRERGMTFFTTATYAFDKKYILNVTGNYEGSNRAGKSSSTRWLPTYNIGAKWNIDQEPFIQDVSWISKLAFRPSYGLVGLLADNVSNNLAVFRNVLTDRFNPNTRENAINIDELQNTELTWEKTLELNLGLEAGFLDNRISFVADVYFRKGKDLIDQLRTSGVGGQAIKLANNANMTTNGVELQLNTNNIVTPNFTWNTTINFSYFDQEITELQQRPNVFDLVSQTGGNAIGFPRGSLFSFQFDKLDERGVPTFVFNDDRDPITGVDFQEIENILDYLKYEGPIEPNYSGGISNNFTYKNWGLSFFATFSAGNKIRLDPYYSSRYSDLSVFPKEFTDRWISPGDENITNVPVIPSRRLINEVGTNEIARAYNAYNFSSERIADGSFIRMKNISLSYAFNKEMLDAIKLSSVRLTFQSTNPFLIYSDKKLKGQDPEFFRTGGVAYPIAKQYTLSLNVGF
ncbi:SusC/RagA family TonB-linked outer membrane protein [Aquimarina sp. 2201CG1-2-11]|uniref:SusC/RagA family TonB-linked outer membrane protein n=1 Tax=Aquimarina discodermiae TaxID=3231043 RepID=UPI003461E7D5